MGYKFTPEFISFLAKKYSLSGQAGISVDQFIVLCVQIQRFTGFITFIKTTEIQINN